MRFADALVGVAVFSYPGRLLRTEDGGATWVSPAELPMYWVRRVWLLDRQTIVVTGFRQYSRVGYPNYFANLTLSAATAARTGAKRRWW
ncbi:MAG: hypothetical protein M3Y32_07490 [Pseudomonadota bacterium]|nr:hypothetical protein [Pseudomonadota bacterium]